MERYPSLSSAGGILRGLDYGGTVVFAYSGAITAASYNLDLLGVCMVGTITAIGGGTLRDLVIFARAPFWSGENGEHEYVYMSLLAAGAAFFLYPSLKGGVLDEDGLLIKWGDALGLGAFAVIGAMNGVRASLPPLLCVLCGISTATFGGLTRDVLVARKGGVRILHSYAEVYASCAAAGAGAYLLARSAAAPLWLKILSGVFVGVASRAVAWEHNVTLPNWQSLGAQQLVVAERQR
jgi:uncharacterized membrane protein YeiH